VNDVRAPRTTRGAGRNNKTCSAKRDETCSAKQQDVLGETQRDVLGETTRRAARSNDANDCVVNGTFGVVAC
jgi:hypothetical protein